MKIALDFDNCLCDLSGGFINFLKTKGIEESLENCIYYEYWREKYPKLYPEFYNNYWNYKEGRIPFYEGAKEFILRCFQEFGKDNVYISSLTHNPDVVWAKHQILTKLINHEIIFQAPSYSKYETTKDSILVEDSYLNLIQHIKINKCPGIMFNYKRKNLYVWDDYNFIWNDRMDIDYIEDYEWLFIELKAKMRFCNG